jgi:hypothetical protein
VESPKDRTGWVLTVGTVLVGLGVLLEIVANLMEGHWPLGSIALITMGILVLSAMLLWRKNHRD